MTDEARRLEDKSVVARAAYTAKTTSRTFWNWAEQHHVDSLVVIIVTLSLTVRVVEWAMAYAYAPGTGFSGTDKAAIIAAILGPWGLMQGAMFKFYTDLKKPKEGTDS
jgi:hypothetical protein